MFAGAEFLEEPDPSGDATFDSPCVPEFLVLVSMFSIEWWLLQHYQTCTQTMHLIIIPNIRQSRLVDIDEVLLGCKGLLELLVIEVGRVGEACLQVSVRVGSSLNKTSYGRPVWKCVSTFSSSLTLNGSHVGIGPVSQA